MSGFDKDWLALRELVDSKARNKDILSRLSSSLLKYWPDSAGGGHALVDIGCGTGSTYRSLMRALPEEITSSLHWSLLDYDPLLLAEAERRIGKANGKLVYQQHDLNDLDRLNLDGTAFVTASALFDLCSEAFCRRFRDHLVKSRCGLYAALNYDGKTHWSVEHPLDQIAVQDFNRHQRTEKGFGPALGPDATATLQQLFSEAGYQVVTGESPWEMSGDEALLQKAFFEGFRQPLTEIGSLDAREIDTWLAFRIDAISAPGSLCVVGHTDLLALPV